ncbi:MAG: ABC transporter ATP-binding protein [Anaerolineales bacterium]
MSEYLEIKNLQIGFRTYEGDKQVLNIEKIAIDRGETYGLVGESGAGKTVLALTILNLLPPASALINNGEICFDGENLLAKTQKEMRELYRGKRISMIFQDPMSTLNPVFTVGQQVGRVIQYHRGLRGKELEKKSFETLEMVKLPDASSVLNKYPHELSGGQRQRVIIAIALSCGAEFLIADEPTRNLDVTIQAGVLKLIDELQRDLNISVLFIANNMGLVNVICKNIGILYRGKIIETGTSQQVIHNHFHPYTEALISAIPRDKSEKLKFASAIVRPDAAGGCPYYARCPQAMDICVQKEPLLEKIKDGHQAACFLPR